VCTKHKQTQLNKTLTIHTLFYYVEELHVSAVTCRHYQLWLFNLILSTWCCMIYEVKDTKVSNQTEPNYWREVHIIRMAKNTRVVCLVYWAKWTQCSCYQVIRSYLQNKQDRQCTYSVLLEWKSNNYYIFVRVCACACQRVRACAGGRIRGRVNARAFLLIQHATRVRHIVTSFVPLANHIFRRYLTKGTFFGKVWSNIKCVFWFSLQIYLNHVSF
jgi:hypothetical protein